MLGSIMITLLVQIYLALSEDYCAEDMKCKGIENSGCNCEFGPNCTNQKEHALTKEIRKSLLAAHNKYREKIASGEEQRGGVEQGATEMYSLRYDRELEHTANCWNKKCQFDHDECRITKTFSHVGQNIYWSSGSTCDWSRNSDDATKSWYEEVQYMTAECIKSFGSGCSTSQVGHFTQLVWSRTTHVGCSLVEYAAAPSCQVICNYGPAGNFPSQPVFETGTPASKCKFQSNKYKHLCSVSKSNKQKQNSAGIRWEMNFAVSMICLLITRFIG